TELQNVLADVRRGIWQPPAPAVEPQGPTDPTFHEFASDWFDAKRRTLRASTALDYEWRLSHHLLPHFAAHRLSTLTVAEVDRYRERKVRQGTIGAESINKTIGLLGQILDVADERGLIDRNPVRVNPRNRKLTAPKPKRTWIDGAEHLVALLEGAGKLDADARRRPGQRRALVATLAFAGLRIGELLALTWRDVDLARGTITVRRSKTDAGERVVDILPVLRDELDGYRSRIGGRIDPGGWVFATSTGGQLSYSAVRNRILAPSIERADAALAEHDGGPLAAGLTPHSLRRTFASILVALGEDPAYVMAQMGHTDPSLTLRVYAQQMRRRDGERERLRALVNGDQWVPSGAKGAAAPPAALPSLTAAARNAVR
ncbi:MAG: tyrosine-type recombinase/integrase, partial [Solirubrobacteraceae bacterium]